MVLPKVTDQPEGLGSSMAMDIAMRLGEISGGRVLDVGTGKGDFIRMLMHTLKDYDGFTGIDVARDDLEAALKEFEGEPVIWVRMDASNLGFHDGEFDTVCISHSLHHLQDVEGALGEMLRVLRPGGAFILQELFSDGEQSPAQRTDILVGHWSARIDSLLGEFHRETYTRDEIRSFVDCIGLHDVTFLETTHGVMCLYCEDRFKCEEPLDPESVDHHVEEIERDLERLGEVTDGEVVDSLEREGRDLIGRVRETGVSPASTLFVIGRK